MQNEEPIIEAPVAEPASQPSFEPAGGEGAKKKTGLIIAIIAVIVVLVIGGFVALFLIEKAKAEENERRAAAVTVDDDIELSKKGFKSEKKKNTENTNEEDDTEEEDEEKPADETKYLEPAGWAVRFKYPEGVTDVKYDMQDINYDSEMYITGIVTENKIYDVNLCGGKVQYNQYPFIIGQVVVWNPNAAHEDWQSSPVSMGLTLAFKEGGIEYFVDSGDGNGCATNPESADYAEAVRLTKLLIDSIEKK